MSVLLIGFSVEQAYFERFSRKDALPQVAARKFERGFIDGFVAHGKFAGTIGFFAGSTFPANPAWWFPGKRWRYEDKSAWTLPFINLPFLKLASRTLVMSVALIAWLAAGRRPRALCVYSAHTPLLIAAFVARLLFGLPYFVIVPDLPRFMGVGVRRSIVFRMAKKLDGLLIDRLVAKSNGISVVTRFMAADVPAWRHLPSVVIEGILDSSYEEECAPRQGRPYFVYSGGLNSAYGVEALVRGFLESNIDADLRLCGAGDLVDFIKSCSETDSRICYCGFLGQEDLRQLQRGAVGLLLTRPSDDPYVRYSFPSKLIEYMSTGVPVLSTRLPGVPEEYWKHVTVLDGVEPRQIAGALDLHLCRDIADRVAQGRRAREFVVREKSARVAVVPLLKLMEGRDV